ncbi:hypothetical protein, partial [Vibrio sp. Evd11]|uniref:hypothetical protein n=1 Tax=Vibrio sp. Evd11 TaxID=1207404 RepID=UPI001C1F8518
GYRCIVEHGMYSKDQHALVFTACMGGKQDTEMNGKPVKILKKYLVELGVQEECLHSRFYLSGE